MNQPCASTFCPKSAAHIKCALPSTTQTNNQQMKSDFSEGRSGSFFFRTRRYMVKTLTEEEYSFLRSIMHSYYEHMRWCYRTKPRAAASTSSSAEASRERAGSLMARIFGVYSITLYGCTQYFCVLEDLFYNKSGVKTREAFDLKGSWVDRVCVCHAFICM